MEVEEYIKCNTMTCPRCGDRMRAVETGEYRTSVQRTITAESGVSCAVCGFPILMKYVGQQVKCPSCGTINEAISQVTIPSPVFAGIISFTLGVVLGPALIASTQSGAEWLAKKARERLT
jgi:DNA-directed RNA polymerase subunit RPC12/RpoP